MTAPASPSPQRIYIIRHGEKPADPATPSSAGVNPPPGPPFGVDADGNQNVHCLLPRGWQRSGALTALFNPATGAPPAGLSIPTGLYSPSYGNPSKTQAHRTFQTIQGLSARLGVAVQSPVPEGQEAALIAAILASGETVALICWEHHLITALTHSIPTVNADAIPLAWSGDRFDVVWTFVLDLATGRYVFGQVPQQLLQGDTATIMSTLSARGST